MGVVVFFAGAADADIEDLLVHPERFSRFMLGGELVFESPDERARWFRDGTPPKSLANASPPPKCDIDKAWDAIHYLLSKGAGDVLLGFIKEGGTPILQPKGKKQARQEEIARAFRSSDVRRLWDALRPMTSSELASRCDLRELAAADLYPFRDRWAQEDVAYVLHWYEVMRAFIRQTAEHGSGMLVAGS